MVALTIIMAIRASNDRQLSNDRIIDRIYKNHSTKSLFPYFWAQFKPSFINQQREVPTIAIVILNWNGRQHLETFLPSVMASTCPFKEVIVADNASTDDSVAYLNATYPPMRIISLCRNYGFAGGYNEALKQVQSDYYVLLNSDVEVTPGWIEPILDLM